MYSKAEELNFDGCEFADNQCRTNCGGSLL